MGTRRFVQVWLLAGCFLVPGAVAAAKPVTIPIKATLTGTFHPASDGVVCPVDERGVCGVKYRGDGTFTGDLVGTVRFWGTEWVPLQGPTYSNEMLEFAGTVKGCGQGTFTYFADPVDDGGIDPAAGGYRGSETWNIPAGYASGGLNGLSGSGISPWLLRYDNTVIAEYTGTITCERAEAVTERAEAVTERAAGGAKKPNTRGRGGRTCGKGGYRGERTNKSRKAKRQRARKRRGG